MSKKMLQQILTPIESARFISLSKLPISEAAHQSIANSNEMVFGDANRSLFTLSRISRIIDADDYDINKKDQEIMEALIEKYGEEFYVDVEN